MLAEPLSTPLRGVGLARPRGDPGGRRSGARPIRRRLGVEPLLAASGSLLARRHRRGLDISTGSLSAVVAHGRTAGWESIALATGAAVLLALAVPRRAARTMRSGFRSCWRPSSAAMLLPGQYPLVAVAGLSARGAGRARVAAAVLGRFDRATMAGIGVISAIAVATIVALRLRDSAAALSHVAPPRRRPGRGGRGDRRAVPGRCRDPPPCLGSGHVGRVRVPARRRPCGRCRRRSWAASSCSPTPAVALDSRPLPAGPRARLDQLGAGRPGAGDPSLRGNHRGLRAGGVALLFVALGKLFLYDLTSLTAMSRAVSFIVTGPVLLLAALLLQRFAPQVKAALGDEPPEAIASTRVPVGSPADGPARRRRLARRAHGVLGRRPRRPRRAGRAREGLRLRRPGARDPQHGRHPVRASPAAPRA